MLGRHAHLSAQELLLTVDRELSPRRLARARRHLAACPACHSRLTDMERALEEVTDVAHQGWLPAPMPPASAARARLQRHLGSLSHQPRPSPATWIGHAAVAAALVVAGFLGVQRLTNPGRAPVPSHAFAESGVFLLPRPDLTPGVTEPVTAAEVCGSGRYGRTRPVPVSLHQRVFENYGADYGQAAEYELDYLITPELGGTSDPRNLWPQSYSRTPWNAYVKDELELHLHRLACEGQIDFATAQREMATDWIAAYKRHFNTDRPRRDYAASPLTEHDTALLLSELDEVGVVPQPSHAAERGRRALSTILAPLLPPPFVVRQS